MQRRHAQSQDFHVVAWGVCAAATRLTLNLEILNLATSEVVVPPREDHDRLSLLSNLTERSSRVVQIIRAVTEYARGSSDYELLARTFDDLAGNAASDDERTALLLLQRNSLAFAQSYTP